MRTLAVVTTASRLISQLIICASLSSRRSALGREGSQCKARARSDRGNLCVDSSTRGRGHHVAQYQRLCRRRHRVVLGLLYSLR